MEDGVFVQQAADVATCVSNSLHDLHLAVQGVDFDSLHRQVLQKYYDEASEDFDVLAEKSLMWLSAIPSKGEAGERLSFKYEQPLTVSREYVIKRVDDLLKYLLDGYVTVYTRLNQRNDARCIATANWLQGRIEYWASELYYFNEHRR